MNILTASVCDFAVWYGWGLRNFGIDIGQAPLQFGQSLQLRMHTGPTWGRILWWCRRVLARGEAITAFCPWTLKKDKWNCRKAVKLWAKEEKEQWCTAWKLPAFLCCKPFDIPTITARLSIWQFKGDTSLNFPPSFFFPLLCKLKAWARFAYKSIFLSSTF